MADLDAVAAIIEPHLDGNRRREIRAQGSAQDLADAGLLPGAAPTNRSSAPVREQAAAVLQCRLPWGPAERIAADLDAAGLLRREVDRW